ncbi:hypothetical protein TL16_g00561 [Triparma laevis f. inornata]|uniref:Uncharacterized protein n=1 Tax=Triparma laevis f. inornata TaxID=1714386 RepID=A0A9W7DN01_9STRA|nr:hypothetical protein TL16_g00561 [Triparma laevis f. inornata]
MKRPVRPSLTGRSNAKVAPCSLHVSLKSVSIKYHTSGGSNPQGSLDEHSTLSIMIKRGGKSVFIKPDNVEVAPGLNSNWTGDRTLDLDITLYGLEEGLYETKNYDLVVGKSVNEKNGGFNELATFAFDASKFCGDVEKRVELCQSRSTGRNGFLEVRAVAVIDCVPGKFENSTNPEQSPEDGGGGDHEDDNDDNDDVVSVASTTNINVSALYSLREELESAKEELKKERQSKEDLLTTVRKELDTTKTKKDQEIGALDKIEMAAELAAGQLPKLEDKIMVASKRNLTLSVHNEQFERKVGDLESTRAALSDEKSKLEEVKSELEEKIRQLEESNAEAKEEFERNKTKLERVLEDAEATRLKEVRILKQERDSKVAEVEKEGKEKLEKQRVKAEKKLEEQIDKDGETFLTDLTEKAKELTGKYEAKENVLEEYHSGQMSKLREKTDAEIKDLKATIQSKDDEMELFKEETEELVRLQHEEFDDATQTLDQELMKKKEEFEETLENTRSDLILAKLEIAELNMTISSQKMDTSISSMTMTPVKGGERRSSSMM